MPPMKLTRMTPFDEPEKCAGGTPRATHPGVIYAITAAGRLELLECTYPFARSIATCCGL